jgi:hypothetical protein
MEEIRVSVPLKSYVINLSDEVSRLRLFREQEAKTKFQSVKIKPVSFKDPRLCEEIEALVASKPDIDGLKKAKEISNRLTFSDILRNETAEMVAIFEDDVYFKDNAKEVLRNIMMELPKNFGICYLGCYLRGGVEVLPYSENLLQIKGREARIWGAHAIIFHSSIYKKVSEMLSSSRSRITDIQIAKEILPNHLCFVANPMIAFQSKEAIKMTVGGTMHSGSLNFDELEADCLKYINEQLKGKNHAEIY